MPEVKIDCENATLMEMMDYLMSKTNIAKSAYDATAIACMNRLFLELRKDTRKFDAYTGEEKK